MEQAQADGALLLHQNRKNNILTQGYVKRGNIEKGFKIRNILRKVLLPPHL